MRKRMDCMCKKLLSLLSFFGLISSDVLFCVIRACLVGVCALLTAHEGRAYADLSVVLMVYSLTVAFVWKLCVFLLLLICVQWRRPVEL